MSADLAVLGLKVDSRPVSEASKDLERITQAAGRAEKAATSFGTRADTAARKAQAANDNLARSGQRVDGIYAKLTRTVMAFGGALLGAFSVRAITQMVDTWSDLNARVGLAIRDMDGAGPVMDRLATVARRTYSALGLTAESFVANSTALRELGYTTAQQLDYVEGLNLALVVSGARAERAASVQNALSQAMALGVLRGDQLNSVIMNGGRVAELLAEEMGVGVNQLRALGTQGKITGDVINRALTGNLEKLREEAELMPATIGDGFTLIGNAIMQYVGNMDQATGASETFATGLIVVADNIDRIITTAATAVTMYGTYYVAAFVAANLATMTLVGALRLLRTALIRTGIFAVIVAAGELVYWFTRLVQGAGGFGEAMSLLKNVAVAAFQEMDHAGEGLWHALQGVALKIAEAFTNAFALVAENFGKLIDHLTGVGRINDLLEFTGASFRLPTAAGFAADGMRETARGFGQRGADAFARSADAFRGMEGTKAAIEELRAALANMDTDADSAADAAKRLQQALDEVGGSGGGGGGAAAAAADAIQDMAAAARDAAQAAMDFTKEVVGGFINDLRSGLKQGQSFFEAFASAATRALDRIVDKLLNDVLNAIFTVNNAGGGGGILGIIGSLFGGGMGGGFGFAGPWGGGGALKLGGGIFPGYANGTNFHPGGMAWVGERGPELLNLPRGSQVIPNHRIAANENSRVRIEVDVSVNDDGTLGVIARQAGREGGQEAAEVRVNQFSRSELPDRVQAIQRNPRRRG